MTRTAGSRLGLVVLLCTLTVVLPAPSVAARHPDAAAVAAGRAFLDRYVEEGRVVRHDQSGDTVSEGQAYAMLIAVGLGDQGAFDDVWRWTATHLQRDDGLLAWRWADGHVVDPMPASDADLAAASALALAAARFSEHTYLTEARRIATGMLAHETAPVSGRTALVAGPWAAHSGTVNLSYLIVNAMSRLLWATGDHTWAVLAATARVQIDTQTATWPHLPPDWSAPAGDGRLAARRAPDDRSVRFGYDAARVIVQLAVDCDPAGRELAARTWRFFRGIAPDDVRAEYAIDGRALGTDRHPLMLVAAASAAAAAGNRTATRDLLDAASALDADHPTYYGAAWIALGRMWLDTDRLGGCRPI